MLWCYNQDKWKKGSQENRQPCTKVLLLTSLQVLTKAKTAITSWMLSVCFTSIALQSLLPCPLDIGHIFHSTVEDWHWVGKGSFEVENGWVRQREEKDSTYVGERQKLSCLQRISGWCLARHWIEKRRWSWPSNLCFDGSVDRASETEKWKDRTSEVLLIWKGVERKWVGLCWSLQKSNSIFSGGDLEQADFGILQFF